MTTRPTGSFTLVTVSLVLAAPAAAGEGTWTAIDLHRPEWYSSQAYCTRDGKQTGEWQTSSSASTSRAALWSGSSASLVTLSDQASRSHGLGGVDAFEQVGGYITTGQALRWAGTPESVVSLHPQGSTASYATTTDGTQQGGYAQIPMVGEQACIWTGSASSCVLLGPAGTSRSRVSSVHNGIQVGFVQFGDYPGYQVYAAAWTGSAGSYVNLSPGNELGMVYGSAICVHDGNIVGSMRLGTRLGAVLWHGMSGGYTPLEPAGASGSTAYGVYNNLQVGEVGFPVGSGYQVHAVLWSGTAASCVDLHGFLPDGGVGYTGSSAYSVWTNGHTTHVVGRAQVASGRYHAILWTKSDGPAACGPADVGGAGGEPGPDGLLDNNDFIVFIGYLFGLNAAADFGQTGGLPGADGEFDNNDFIAFINAFFGGC